MSASHGTAGARSESAGSAGAPPGAARSLVGREDRALATTWQGLCDGLDAAVRALDAPRAPIILSSLSEPAGRAAGRGPLAALSFIQGPPGRNIALAIGLRAALPDTPLVLVMSADSVTLGTNHLIHAARRNIGMTLLLLRADLLPAGAPGEQDRAGWTMPAYQRELEAPSRPLDWVAALGASLVGRANLDAPEELAHVLRRALATPGFSVVGITRAPELATGVLAEQPWPEYFAAYRHWAAPLLRPDDATDSTRRRAPAQPRQRNVPRQAIRIAGLGGHGVKLAGTVLAEAAGYYEGLWATQRGDYGSATRGGPSLVDVVLGSAPISYPSADRPDVLVALTQQAADRFARTVGPGGRLICDPGEVSTMPADAISVPIAALAREHTGKPLAAGVVALGCVAALTSAVSQDGLQRSLHNHLPHSMVERNVAACAAGYAATRAALNGAGHG